MHTALLLSKLYIYYYIYYWLKMSYFLSRQEMWQYKTHCFNNVYEEKFVYLVKYLLKFGSVLIKIICNNLLKLIFLGLNLTVFSYI